MSWRYEKTHYRANRLSRIIYDGGIPPHVKETGPRLRVAPPNHLPISKSQESVSFAGSDSFGPSYSMSRASLSTRIPLVTRSIVEPAVASRPLGKVSESFLIEEPEVVVKKFWCQLSDLDFQVARPNNCPIVSSNEYKIRL